jgi:hypothetical protein
MNKVNNLQEELRRQYELLYEQKDFASKLIRYILDKEIENQNTQKNPQIDDTDEFDIPTNLEFKNFRQVTDKIIEKLEGGYYNPAWHYKSGMGRSGETLFGLDRKHGGTLNTSSEGREFWRLVDQNKNKEVWKHYYMPTGSLNEKLRNLLSIILGRSYEEYSRKYLKPESRKIVESDPRLKFHFAYATWNGPGFFQKFANRLNQRIENQNILDPTKLFKLSMQDRRDTVIASSAPKIEKIFNS